MSYSTVDLYADFVASEEWDECLAKIRSVSPAVADAINKHGIGTKLCDDGRYDFESGQLLDDIPSSVKRELEEDFEKCYNLICQLANTYSDYVTENA